MKAPLADRIRPLTVDDMVGQQHLLGAGKALRNIIESGELPNLIFYGPSGIGKTTLLNLIMGLSCPDKGSVEGAPQKISALFQEDRLLNNLMHKIKYLYLPQRQQAKAL